ncbi:MAG: LuxR C-terminal-related transcriptional regulator [Pirellulales bacterium]
MADTVDVWLLSVSSFAFERNNGNFRCFPSLDFLHERYPTSSFVVLDDESDPGRRGRFIQAGFDDCITKEQSFDELLDLVTRLKAPHFGRIDDECETEAELGRCSKCAEFGVSESIKLLTRRELQVFIELAKGMTAKECSQLLQVAPSTLENHRANIMKKLRSSQDD